MSKKEKNVIVKVPHRISGFFEIVDKLNGVKIKNPQLIGSRGAGFNINNFGITEIIAQEPIDPSCSTCQIFINGIELNEEAETTYFIFDYLKQYFKKTSHVIIKHNFDLPVGCGYGASGSGALGAVFGITSLLKLKISDYEKGKIAHIAEVLNKTGLGTICGQLGGGLCILKKPGYPCISERIQFPSDLSVICGSFGMIHTKSILNNPSLNMNIKNAGRNALIKLLQDPSIYTFINTSIEFVQKTLILDILQLNATRELIEDLNKLNIIGASMNQLGRSVYAICNKRNKAKVLDVFNTYKPEIKIIKSRIYEDKTINIMNS
ncbi:MAG: GHMP family kinase ATP-binding protein [Promethearchaeota archaeon]